MVATDSATFTVIPAIDLKDGCCVRLRQGLKDQVTTYSEDPVAMALHWQEQGGRCLHVVDLDGAFSGRPVHHELIARITAALDVPVEVGGGLRSDADIRAVLDAGVERAIIGTRACQDPDALRGLVEQFGSHIAVGIDARDGRVQVKGWVEASGLTPVDLARRADAVGVSTIIYTDTATDGMLQGPNVAAMAEMCDHVSCNVIASGGVSAARDVAALASLRRNNLVGVIVGKALYDERVTFPDLLAAARPLSE